MVELLVGVVVGSLAEHLGGLLGEGVLVHELDARLQHVVVCLLCAHVAVLDALAPLFILLLEVHFVLDRALGRLELEARRLRQEARRVRPWLVIYKCVRVRWLRSETRRRHKF